MIIPVPLYSTGGLRLNRCPCSVEDILAPFPAGPVPAPVALQPLPPQIPFGRPGLADSKLVEANIRSAWVGAARDVQPDFRRTTRIRPLWILEPDYVLTGGAEFQKLEIN